MAKDLLWRFGEDYAGIPLDPAGCDADPIVEFRAWFAAAIAAKLPNANAMTLATIDERDRPAARIVVLKEVDERGFVFFTNYDSRKGRQLGEHPFAALVFLWKQLDRQVHVAGAVERVDEAESDEYFATRPRDAQLGAWASHQSQVISGREELEARLAEVETRFPDVVARPSHWGGFRVRPETIEFWQGRRHRLHDRFLYSVIDGSAWAIERLAP